MKNSILLLLILISIESLHGACGSIIYVKHDATGFINNGSSWTNAYIDLQSALDEAEACPDIQEIWVAEGSYSPTVNVSGGASNSVPQNRTFVIDDNIRLYGGFRGDETSISARISYLYPSILNGDQLGDDELLLKPGAPNNSSDNSFNIMRMKNLDSTTIIDGFTFQGGNAVSTSSTFSKKIGGAIFNDGRGTNNESSPLIINCFFKHNYALFGGGAIYNFGQGGNANPIVINCDFRYNESLFSGGAVVNAASGSDFTAAQVFENCFFFNNKGPQSGGAVATAIAEDASIDQVYNGCTWRDNESANGSAVYTDAPQGSGNVRIYSSVAWYNDLPNFSNTDIDYDIQYSNYNEAVANNTTGNMSLQPKFLFASQNGINSRLSSDSPLIDMGHPSWINESAVDRDGISRSLGGRRDIGAYEFLTCPASNNIYVNDDQIFNSPRGSSVDFALRTLDAGLAMACNCDDKPTLFLSKGTYFPFDLYDFNSFDNTPRNQHKVTLRCPVDIIGEQVNGSFDASAPGPSVIQGDFILDDDSNVLGLTYDDNADLSMLITAQASNSSLHSLTFEGGATSVRANNNITNFNGDFNIEMEDCNFTNVGKSGFARSVDISPNLADGFQADFLFKKCNFIGNTGEALSFFPTGDDASLVLDSCVIRDNKVPDSQPVIGISNGLNGAAVTQMNIRITNTLFEENDNNGIIGSLLQIGCFASNSCVYDVLIDQCDFVDNYSRIETGAIALSVNANTEGQFHVNNCYFDSNSGNLGGACYIENAELLDVTFTNSLFYKNRGRSQLGGGAILGQNNSRLNIYNCSFFENISFLNGGAIYASMGSNISISNSVFWDNKIELPGGATAINSVENDSASSPVTLSNCLIEEPSCSESHMNSFACTSMLFAIDPMIDSIFRPTLGSPLIDAGNNNFVSNTTFDFGGLRPLGVDVLQNYRIINNTVDIGAGEFLKSCSGSLILNPNNLPFSNSGGEIRGAWSASDIITLDTGLETNDPNTLIFDTPNLIIKGEYTFSNGGELEVYTGGCVN